MLWRVRESNDGGGEDAAKDALSVMEGGGKRVERELVKEAGKRLARRDAAWICGGGAADWRWPRAFGGGWRLTSGRQHERAEYSMEAFAIGAVTGLIAPGLRAAAQRVGCAVSLSPPSHPRPSTSSNSVRPSRRSNPSDFSGRASGSQARRRDPSPSPWFLIIASKTEQRFASARCAETAQADVTRLTTRKGLTALGPSCRS